MASGSSEHSVAPPDKPDTLVDLCICYCCQNLEVLTRVTPDLRSHDEHARDNTVGQFPLSLGNRLLNYYLKCCIPSRESQKGLDILLQNQEFCDTINIVRRNMITEENLNQLAKNSISCLSIIGCEDLIRSDTGDSNYSAITGGLHALFERNRHNLRSLKVAVLEPDFENGCFRGAFSSQCNHHGDGDNQQTNMSHPRHRDTDPSGHISGEGEAFSENSCVDKSKENTDDAKNCDNYHFPNLKTLTYHSLSLMMPINGPTWLTNMLTSNKQLTVCNFLLPIYRSSLTQQISLYDQLHTLDNLQSLVLSNTSTTPVPAYSDSGFFSGLFSGITALKHLRHLDLSSAGRVTYEEDAVRKFIDFLRASKRLVSLDVSGTNLSSILRHTNKLDDECTDSESCLPDLPGRRFEYLGLGVNPECRHKHIPARKVSGVDNEDQLLVSVSSYQHNPGIMYQILETLDQKILRDSSIIDALVLKKPSYMDQLFHDLVTYLDKLLDWNVGRLDESLVIESFCKLLLCFHRILRHKYPDRIRHLLTTRIRRNLLERFLVVISNCVRDVGITFHEQKLNYICRVSLLLLRYLDLPQDAIYCYMFEHYVTVLCGVIESGAADNTKMMALQPLHTTCRASQHLKAVVGGELGTTRLLLDLIDDRVSEAEDSDEILEKLWSVLWTLTDEVPANCARFLQYGGARICLKCLQYYPGQYELYKKISGAMSNVSECPDLRPRLMTNALVGEFRSMLEPMAAGIDVSSHAVAFLVLLLADGPAAWTVDEPARDVVVQEVEAAVDGWDILQARGVRFRSLSPMLIQIENYGEHVSQYWGAWMICNLVKVKPNRYMAMLQDENGVEILCRVSTHPALSTKVKDLITTILADVNLYDGDKSDTD